VRNLKRDFALEPGGPKRLMVEYDQRLTHAEVYFDGQKVMSFANAAEFKRGTTCKLADGSLLTAKFAPIEGTSWIRMLKGVHLILNGKPVAGSASEPLPKWAWALLAACGVVALLGGVIPGLIGCGGAMGVVTFSRESRWSLTTRISVCTGITAACWIGILVLIVLTAGVKAGAARTRGDGDEIAISEETGKKVELTPNEELLHEIAVTYYQHGYLTSQVAKMKDYYADECDTMSEKDCSRYLEQELVTAKKSPQVK
jgi:hypothetical protein